MSKNGNEKDKLPMLTVKASLTPKTFDKEQRTIECVLTSSIPVDRSSWSRGYYRETLSMDPKHIRTERVNSGGAPVLNNHGTAFFGGIKDLSDVIGVIDKFWIDGEEAKAILRFADTSDVEIILRKIETGILKNISIGYIVHKYEDITPRNAKGELDEDTLLKAVDWELFEGSVVAIPADYTAMMKSKSAGKELQLYEVEIVQRTIENEKISAPGAQALTKEITMDPIEVPAAIPAPAAPAVDTEAVKAQAIKAERDRVASIKDAVKKAKLSDAFGDALAAKEITVDAARAAIIDELAKSTPAINSQNPSVTVTVDARDTFREAVTDAILHRADAQKFKITEKGRKFVGFSMREIARECLRMEGIKSEGMNVQQLVARALHTTSDLPYILADGMNKTLRKAYDEMPKTFTGWAKKGTLNDFKAAKRIQMGNFPSLLKVLEHGEIHHLAVNESQETLQLATYAGIIGFTRQAIINDDLGAIERLSSGAGFAASALESDVVYGVLTANAVMADGNALFSVAHGNLAGTPAAISIASLSAARAAMRVQKTLEGRLTNLSAKYLIVPAALETVAQQYVQNLGVVGTLQSVGNPFVNQLTLVVDPRLDATSTTAWYLAAEPNLIDTVEYVYLEGAEGVYTETRMGFEIDGVEVKARHDFAAKAIDYRGLYKNAGV